MGGKTRAWTEYEIDIIKSMWETTHLKEIIHLFNNKTIKAVSDKATHLGLHKKIQTSGLKKIHWSEDETSWMISNYSLYTKNEIVAYYKTNFTEKTSNSIKKLANKLKLISKSHLLIWSDNDLKLLRKLWGDSYGVDGNKNLEEIFNRPIVRIDAKAYELKLKKSQVVSHTISNNKAKNLLYRNKFINGRNVTYEFAKTEILKYNSKQEVYRKDSSLYQFIYKSGYWDELCSHMVIGDSFNYPQTFLYNCISILFPNYKIRYNDRTAIKPKEIDIYIPELKLGFEYDGLVYHSSDEMRIKDEDKNKICIENDIKLYRINEKSKAYPEDVILNQLKDFGFDISIINVDNIIQKTFSMKYSDKMINDIIKKYTTYKDFKKENFGLYSFIMRKGYKDKYIPKKWLISPRQNKYITI